MFPLLETDKFCGVSRAGGATAILENLLEDTTYRYNGSFGFWGRAVKA